jgi:hypothetical protein
VTFNVRRGKFGEQLIVQSQDGFRVGQHQIPLLSQHRSPAVGSEQYFSSEVFQSLHLQSDGRLRASEPARSLGHAPGLDHGNERTQNAHIDTEEAHDLICRMMEIANRNLVTRNNHAQQKITHVGGKMVRWSPDEID